MAAILTKIQRAPKYREYEREHSREQNKEDQDIWQGTKIMSRRQVVITEGLNKIEGAERVTALC